MKGEWDTAAGVEVVASMRLSTFWKPRDEKSRNVSVLIDSRDLDRSLQTAYSIKGRTFEKKNTMFFFSFPNISLATQTKHIELAGFFFSFLKPSYDEKLKLNSVSSQQWFAAWWADSLIWVLHSYERLVGKTVFSGKRAKDLVQKDKMVEGLCKTTYKNL